MNKKITRILVVALALFISSFIGAIIGALIYGPAVFSCYCVIVALIAGVELLFESCHKTKDQRSVEKFFKEIRANISAKLLITMVAIWIIHFVALSFGLVAEIIVGAVICLLVTKVAFKCIDESTNNEICEPAK